MTESLAALADLCRPSLLIKAARFGLKDYDRRRALRRIFQSELPSSGTTLARLLEREAELDGARRAADTAYDVAAHVEVLTAVLGEARQQMRATEAAAGDPAQPNASAIEAFRRAT